VKETSRLASAAVSALFEQVVRQAPTLLPVSGRGRLVVKSRTLDEVRKFLGTSDLTNAGEGGAFADPRLWPAKEKAVIEAEEEPGESLDAALWEPRRCFWICPPRRRDGGLESRPFAIRPSPQAPRAGDRSGSASLRIETLGIFKVAGCSHHRANMSISKYGCSSLLRQPRGRQETRPVRRF